MKIQVMWRAWEKAGKQKIEKYIWEQQINKLPVTVIGNNVGKIGWAWYGKGTLEYWADQSTLFYGQKDLLKACK